MLYCHCHREENTCHRFRTTFLLTEVILGGATEMFPRKLNDCFFGLLWVVFFFFLWIWRYSCFLWEFSRSLHSSQTLRTEGHGPSWVMCLFCNKRLWLYRWVIANKKTPQSPYQQNCLPCSLQEIVLSFLSFSFWFPS